MKKAAIIIATAFVLIMLVIIEVSLVGLIFKFFCSLWESATASYTPMWGAAPVYSPRWDDMALYCLGILFVSAIATVVPVGAYFVWTKFIKNVLKTA